MKRLAAILAAAMLVTGMSGCGSKQGNAPVSSALPLQTIQTGTAAPSANGTAQPTDASPTATDDSNGQDQPQLTPWPEPTSIDYTGSSLSIAQDADASKYPALTVSQQVDTCYGTLKIPAKWSISDPDGTPTLVDDKGRSVGQLFQANAYATQPYFGLYTKDDGTIMTWVDNTSFKYDAREFALESDHPSVDDSKKQKTIIKTVCLLADEPNNDDTGAEYYPAYCLSIDKAYITGSTVEYIISNQAIAEMMKSLADGLDVEQ